MKNMIIIALLPLIVLSFFSILIGNEFVRIEIDPTHVFSTAEGDFGSGPAWFDFDPITTTLAVLIAIALGVALVGTRILGSGLSDKSVRIVGVGILYTAIWSFLSLLAYPLIRSIQEFGLTIYIVLTVLYTLGVIDKMISDD